MPGVPTYRPRPMHWLGVHALSSGWQVKTYAMHVEDAARPEVAVVEAALDHAHEALPPQNEHRVGFLLLHRARPANFVLVSWWQGVDLKQLYYRSSHAQPARLERLPAHDVGCVWELEVLIHERAAWITHVLDRREPDYAGYLNDVPTPLAEGVACLQCRVEHRAERKNTE